MSSSPDIWQFDPYEFEVFIAELWEDNGYQTNVRQKSNDKGIDIEATKDGEKELIQAKLYNPENTIGSSDVREYATLYQQVPEAEKVIIVTSSTFTSPARELASDLDVSLIDGQALEGMVESADFDVDTVSVDRDPNEPGPIQELFLVGLYTIIGIVLYIIVMVVLTVGLIFF